MVSWANYQVGDQPAHDITTPVPLVVVDHERTETLRSQEASRVPAIFFFNTNSAAEAEVKMLTAYTAAKEGFLKAVERTYKTRKLSSEETSLERFGKVVATFQKQNRSFPLATNLATVWALGEPDQVILEDLSGSLRQTMRLQIRADTLSNHARTGPQQVRLVQAGSSKRLTDLDVALALATPVYKSNFVALTRARKDLQGSFGPETQWAAKFLSAFVTENCVCDDNLTLESRNRRTNPIVAADTFEAGAIVVKAGALIDAKMKAALDELARRTEADTLKFQAAEEQRRADMVAAQLRQAAAEANIRKNQTERRYLFLLSSLTLAAGGGLWFAVRRRQPRTLLPALADHNPTPAIVQPQLPPEIRAKLLPTLRQWMQRHFLVLRAHAALNETQRQAALRVAELEQRLEEIKGPLQEKLKAYEQRIGELERELEAKGAENRELLEATIKMARERLEAQRTREGVAWN